MKRVKVTESDQLSDPFDVMVESMIRTAKLNPKNGNVKTTKNILNIIANLIVNVRLESCNDQDLKVLCESIAKWSLSALYRVS